MDAAVILAAAAGALAALLPGAHPNGVAPWAAEAGLLGAGALVALAAAHACAAPAVGAFLGASEETALSAAPAHRMLAQGRAREAAELAADGAILGVLLALLPAALLVLALRGAAGAVAAVAPAALAVLVALLVLSARRRTVAAGFLLLSGLLGFLALRTGTASPLGWPSHPLLPLLAGLFGAPGLLALARLRRLPPQKAYRAVEPLRRLLRAAGRGTAAGALVGLLPALTAGVAAGPLLRNGEREETPIVLLAAAQGAGAVFTLGALFALDKARSGALAAARALEPVPRWEGIPPPQLAGWAAALLLGAMVGYAAARVAAALLPRLLDAVAPVAVGGLGLLLLGGTVAALTGPVGLLVAATGCSLATAAGRAGAPRTVLLGSLLLPALAALTGLRAG